MPPEIPVWKKAPFLRLLLPVIAGILIQWYFQFYLQYILLTASCFILALIFFYILPISARYKLQTLQGFLINLILIVFGLFITHQKDIRNTQNWFGKTYQEGDYIIASINEPIIEKNKSYKAEALVKNILQNDSLKNTSGKIIIYFEKDSINPIQLKYGDEILITKKPQQIKNSGNPGAFNFKQYAAFHQIFHNVFLKSNDWVLLNKKSMNYFNTFLFTARQNILNILQKNLNGHDDQLSIAEALLIGYTQDLDKDLVQAYSNTGVVHIIAISGMHLALIYILLGWIFNKIPIIKRSKIINAVLILLCLWFFTLLTGGAASILRAAVMFTCVDIGRNFGKRTSIYNSLAASAFILLCYNPYFLWDVGFQLSYLAVLSIVIFQKPIYNILYIKNKWLNKLWALISVTLAAQIFTFPVCLYYFHQFPTLFLFTNILLVPFSSLVLFVEIFLVSFAWLPFGSFYAGKLTWWLIWLMNKTILWFNDLPYSILDKISATVLSTIILYAIIICAGFWLLNKNKSALRFLLLFFLAFAMLNSFTKWQSANQQKIIIYNVPRYQSIDFITGNDYKFIGDQVLTEEGMLQNFHLKPGRIKLQLTNKVNALPALYSNEKFYNFYNKKILLLDTIVPLKPSEEKINIDYIILSKNPKLYISQLAQVFNCSQFIFDGSNTLWKIAKWKKECEELHLRCYSVPEQGAFVLDL